MKEYDLSSLVWQYASHRVGRTWLSHQRCDPWYMIKTWFGCHCEKSFCSPGISKYIFMEPSSNVWYHRLTDLFFVIFLNSCLYFCLKGNWKNGHLFCMAHPFSHTHPEMMFLRWREYGPVLLRSHQRSTTSMTTQVRDIYMVQSIYEWHRYCICLDNILFQSFASWKDDGDYDCDYDGQ